MTDLAIHYIQNPFKALVNIFVYYSEVIGYARAATALARLGYHEEAKICLMQIKAIKAKNK